MRLKPEFVAKALGLPKPASSTAFTGVTTDSRAVQPGDLFVALKGDKFDGHAFLPEVIAKGAGGVIASSLPPDAKPKPGFVFFPAADPLAAYRKLARQWRKEFPIPVVLIAGAVGKTTTKELLSAIFRGKHADDVLQTKASENGFIGGAKTLLNIRGHHKLVVLEIGIDEPGAMAQHLELAGANAAVVTAIAEEHLEKLRDLDTVTKEECLSLETVHQNGGLIAVNWDDARIRGFAEKHFAKPDPRKISFTLDAGMKPPEPAFRGTLSADGAALEVQGPGFSKEKFALPLPGRHNAGNLLAALALAQSLGVTVAEARRGLASFTGADGRSQWRTLPSGTKVLCDYYNASPASMKAGLELLAQAGSGERWACLGDMLELGPQEEAYHRCLADSIVALGVEHVLLFGPRMKALYDELKKRKYTNKFNHFETKSELVSHLKPSPRAQVLIKGSRSMRMEEVWAALQPPKTV